MPVPWSLEHHSRFKLAPAALVLKCPLTEPSGHMLGTTYTVACSSNACTDGLLLVVNRFSKPVHTATEQVHVVREVYALREVYGVRKIHIVREVYERYT